MWVAFFGVLALLRGVFSEYPGFPFPPENPTFLNFNSIWLRDPELMRHA